MMSQHEILKLKFQLYESREKFHKIVNSINKNEKQPEMISPIFELISQIYTEKIELLNIILNHKNNE